MACCCNSADQYIMRDEMLDIHVKIDERQQLAVNERVRCSESHQAYVKARSLMAAVYRRMYLHIIT